ncbi:MAG: LamG domain-containing protein, partial [Victivallaceae bacterium]|nr:LamG domain-containing protein [Victivallaceae bacterium]
MIKKLNFIMGFIALLIILGGYKTAADPVAIWKFDETSGTNAADSEENSDGTLINLPETCWVPGKINNALEFDGIDGYVTCGNDSSIANLGTRSFSIEGWVKYMDISGGSGDNPVLFGMRRSQTPITLYELTVTDGGHLGYYIKDDNGNTVSDEYFYPKYDTDPYGWQSYYPKLDDNEWHHVCMTVDRDNNVLKMYCDGMQVDGDVDISALTGNIDVSGGWSYIGRAIHGSDAYFNGLLDEVRIYNTALNANDVYGHYLEGNSLGNWSLNETSQDSSPYGNDGTLVNMDVPGCWVEGKIGKALSFDGVNDYVACGNNASIANPGTQNFTIEGWVKYMGVSGGAGDNPVLFGMRRNSPSLTIYELMITDGGTLGYYLRDVNGNIASNDHFYTALNDNKWHYVCMVVDRDNGILEIYCDGVQVGADVDISNVTGDIDVSGGWSYIGRAIHGSDAYFNGIIDEVKVHSIALCAEKIYESYLTASTLANWQFNENVQDSSVNGNDGTMVNMNSSTCWVDGRIRQALKFDGIDDYVTCGNDASIANLGTRNFTIEGWVKYMGASGGDGDNPALFGMRRNSPSLTIYELMITDGGTLGYYIRDVNGNAASNDYFYTALNDNEWHHVGMVVDRDNSVLKMYCDGVQVGADVNISNVTGDIDVSGGWSYVGRAIHGSDAYLNGLIDKLRIYNRALSASEIGKNFDEQGGAYG